MSKSYFQVLIFMVLSKGLFTETLWAKSEPPQTEKPLLSICNTKPWLPAIHSQKNTGDRQCVSRNGTDPLRVCKLGGAGGLVIERAEVILRQWPAGAIMGSSRGLDVVEVDDPAFADKFVIASFEGIGNGMSPPSWKLWLVNSKELNQVGEPKAQAVIDDYGRGNFAHRLDGDKSCALWSTKWRSFKDAKRGWGRYLTGIPLQFDGVHWNSASDKYMVRRLLRSFNREKNRTSSNNGDYAHSAPFPLGWFHRDAGWLPVASFKD